ANHKLAHIQAEGGEAWQTALQYDAMLRQQPRWANKPMSERFQKVVTLVEADIGAINVPSRQQEPVLDAAALARAAEAKAKAAVASTPPKSLSDLRAGDAPHVDELSALEQ